MCGAARVMRGASIAEAPMNVSRRRGWAIGIVVAGVIGCGPSDPAVDAARLDGGRPADAARDAGRELDSAPPLDGAPPLDARPPSDGALDSPALDAPVAPPDADPPPDAPIEIDATVGDDGGVATACTAAIPDLTSEPITDTLFASPIQVVQPPGSTDLYVVQRGGRVRIVRDGAVLATDFLDVSGLLGGTPGGDAEWGLLSLAFHPEYATNGRFFIGYTPNAGDNLVAEGQRMAGDPDRGGSTTVIVTVDDFAGNHNGGLVTFGPDGMLYVFLGDGGGGGDPGDTAQDLADLLGKILRIDVATTPYTIPSGNPFVDVDGAADEIWAYGLRNPWRASFDRDTGDLWIGDVGQGDWEEVDFVPSGLAPGANFGWSDFEGTHDFGGDTLRGPSPHHPPITEYSHDEGNSIVGGFVYRGSAIPALEGVYLFGDSYSNFVRGLRQCDGEITVGPTAIPGLDGGDSGGAALVSFGEDNAGELYVVYLTGQVERIVAP
jgi:glucose/arabinose dehydrogenase